MDEKKNGREIEILPPGLRVARAAQVAGVSRRHIRRMIRAGKLSASRFGDGPNAPVIVDTRSLLRLMGVEVAE